MKMSMKIKAGLFPVTAALLILLPSLNAKLYPDPLLISSPQNTSTAGRFNSDTDNFLSPRNYSGVNFDKWLGLISFSSGQKEYNYNEMAQLGFAAKFGGVYTAAYYGGNAWKNFGLTSSGNTYNYTSQKVNGKTMRVYDSFPEFQTDRNYLILNNAAVLIGMADMGFRLSYGSTYQSFRLDNDFGVIEGADTVVYRNFMTEYGNIDPGLAWGMAKDLIPGRGIRPQVSVDLNFFRNFRKRETYLAGGVPGGEEIQLSGNNLTMSLGLAMGSYTFLEENNFTLGTDLEYSLKVLTYNNKYSYKDSAGIWKIAQLNGGRVQNASANIFADDQRTDNLVTPSLNAAWSANGLSFSAKFGLGMTVWTEHVTYLGLQTGNETSGALVKQGQDQKTTAFVINPHLDTGMSWEIVPGKCTVYAGGVIDFGSVTLTGIQQKMYNQDVEDVSRAEKQTQNSFTPASTKLLLGMGFKPTVNTEFQAVCGVDTGNVINVFSIDPIKGLISFSNILFTLKF